MKGLAAIILARTGGQIRNTMEMRHPVCGGSPDQLTADRGVGGERCGETDCEHRATVGGTTLAAHVLDEVEAVYSGKHQVDDGRVKGFCLRQVQASFTIRGMIDGMALLLQSLPDEGCDIRIVLTQQYAHAMGTSAGAIRPGSGGRGGRAS